MLLSPPARPSQVIPNPRWRQMRQDGDDDVGTTVDEFLDSLKDRPQGVSPKTIRNYRDGITKFALWYEQANGEPMRLRHVAAVDVRDFKDHLQRKEKQKATTINRRLAQLRVYFAWAVGKGLLKVNPVEGVPKLEEPQLAPRSIDEATYHKLERTVEKFGTKRDLAMVQLLRYAGLRVSELCALELSDIKLSAEKGKVIVRSGKGRQYREVPLITKVRETLEDYLARHRPRVDDAHVFIGQRGKMTDAGVAQVLQKYAYHAKIDHISPHMLRHTFGRSLLDKGADLVTAKQLLGHKRIESTVRYTLPTERDIVAAMERMAIEE